MVVLIHLDFYAVGQLVLIGDSNGLALVDALQNFLHLIIDKTDPDTAAFYCQVIMNDEDAGLAVTLDNSFLRNEDCIPALDDIGVGPGKQSGPKVCLLPALALVQLDSCLVGTGAVLHSRADKNQPSRQGNSLGLHLYIKPDTRLQNSCI